MSVHLYMTYKINSNVYLTLIIDIKVNVINFNNNIIYLKHIE